MNDVLYVEGINQRLFSFRQFLANPRHVVFHTGTTIQLQFANGALLTEDVLFDRDTSNTQTATHLNHVVELTPTYDNTAVAINNVDTSTDNESFQDINLTMPGGNESSRAPDAISHEKSSRADRINDTDEPQDDQRAKKRLDLERAHIRFGHRAMRSLIAASVDDVWADCRIDPKSQKLPQATEELRVDGLKD